MQITLAPEYRDTPLGRQAQAILRQCVHCGFCTAVCPTYQLLGDELDGPRGRIYLIKQVLEGAAPTRETQVHLDRCLTCLSCESACPSGVRYGQLLELGRQAVDAKVPRPSAEQRARWLLRAGLPSIWFGPAMKLGQRLRGLLPAALRARVPAPRFSGAWPRARHPRAVLLPAGCAQPSMNPNIDAATARVLDAAGIQVVRARPGGRCCGALKHHLGDPEGALRQARANIDAWWPHIAPADGGQGVQAIVSNASACGLMLKDYGRLLAGDPRYAERAERVSALARDVAELLPELVPALRGRLKKTEGAIAWHAPCTLQHGQRLGDAMPAHLAELGIVLRAPQEAHLCCGSAGTYSLFQPNIANTLRERKLERLSEPHPADGARPARIVSANIGCIAHLQAQAETPVLHWIELIDQLLQKE
ncbi:MAG: glycolate oxidase subunit GlcF [Burkholderiaceae bacterium]|jgi:glycolate oxidase iron-sulfur subunit|nr:glycolate oxidase subunit GlcF [Burkholderiaceae bacterium]